ncbi:MAG: sulfite exporter TauE/SafE family protein [Pseudomonadota bacterium]
MTEYLIISLTSLAVAGLTFFSGFGLGTLLMPAFAVFFPVEIAVAATAFIHLANNIFKIFLVGKNADRRIVLLFALPGAAGAMIGALLLNYFAILPSLGDYTFMGKQFFLMPGKILIAALIVFFALLELSPYLKNSSFSLRFVPLGGVLSGFFGGLSGHQGALRSAFLMRTGLDKQTLIGTMVVSAVVVDFSRLVIYGLTFFENNLPAMQEQGLIGLIIVGSLFAFAGSFAGSRLLKKITLKTLHTIIAVMLLLLALALGAGIL